MTAHLLHKQTHNEPYVVHGVCRKNSINLPILQELGKKLRQNTRLILHYGDVSDPFFMLNLLKETAPDEVYNFAA